MGMPTVEGVGTPNSGIGNVTYALPAHAANDIILLPIECAESVGVTAPAGWAHVTNSPRAQGSNVTAVNVLWRRAASGAETAPTVTDPGNHQVGFTLVVRGVRTSGDPWDFAPVGNGAAGATSFSATGGTTTGVDRLVVVAVAGNADIATDQFTSVANATLASFLEREQVFVIDGNGGGIGVWTGQKATAGATGTTTGSMPSQTYSALTLALVGASAADVQPPRNIRAYNPAVVRASTI